MSTEYYSCACTVKDGKLKLFNREAFDKALFQFGEGVELELVIQEQGRQRTSAQNRFFWGPVCKAFMELGYSKQEVHDMLCLKFLPRQIQTMDGETVVVPGHTSTLKAPEFIEFIECCIRLAAENDIYIEDSDEWRKKHQAA